MNCKYCGGETDNEEEVCNICMLFGPPVEMKENENRHQIEIVQEVDMVQYGGYEVDDEREIDDEQEVDDGQEVDDEQEVGTPRGLYFSTTEYNYLNERTIQSFRQNIPELITQDCIREFNLDDEQVEKLRIILMARGVNKWFYARREFIKLKHQVKEMLKSDCYPYNNRKVHMIIEKIYVMMQNIAKMPRWIEWPRTLTHKWDKIERNIEMKGRRSKWYQTKTNLSR